MARIKGKRTSRAWTETVESWGPQVNSGFQIQFMEDHAHPPPPGPFANQRRKNDKGNGRT